MIKLISKLEHSRFRSLLLRVLSIVCTDVNFKEVIGLLISTKNKIVVESKNRVKIVNLGITIDLSEHIFILEKIDTCENLKEIGFNFRILDNKVFLGRNKLLLKVQTAEDLFIVNEVFFEQDYSFHHSNEGLLVVDIGANKGYTTLFFAEFPNVKKIVSFEPVRQSFGAAKENINMNKHLLDKIELRNYGLGMDSKVEDIYVDPNQLGQSSGRILRSSNTFKPQNCVIKNAREEINQILEESTLDILLKIDTEGFELEILKALEPLLSSNRIKFIVSEWHEDFDPLLNIYTRLGYRTIVTRTSLVSGLIRAFK